MKEYGDGADHLLLPRRKFDHDQVNNLLVRSIPQVAETVTRDYGGGILFLGRVMFSLDDILSSTGLKYYRERVWWTAISYLATTDDQEVDLVHEKLNWESGRVAKGLADESLWSLPVRAVGCAVRKRHFGEIDLETATRAAPKGEQQLAGPQRVPSPSDRLAPAAGRLTSSMVGQLAVELHDELASPVPPAGLVCLQEVPPQPGQREVPIDVGLRTLGMDAAFDGEVPPRIADADIDHVPAARVARDHRQAGGLELGGDPRRPFVNVASRPRATGGGVGLSEELGQHAAGRGIGRVDETRRFLARVEKTVKRCGSSTNLHERTSSSGPNPREAMMTSLSLPWKAWTVPTRRSSRRTTTLPAATAAPAGAGRRRPVALRTGGLWPRSLPRPVRWRGEGGPRAGTDAPPPSPTSETTRGEWRGRANVAQPKGRGRPGCEGLLELGHPPLWT